MLVRLEKGPHHVGTEAHGEKRHGEERFSMRGRGPLLLGWLSSGSSLWLFSVSLCASVVRSSPRGLRPVTKRGGVLGAPFDPYVSAYGHPARARGGSGTLPRQRARRPRYAPNCHYILQFSVMCRIYVDLHTLGEYTHGLRGGLILRMSPGVWGYAKSRRKQ